MDRPEDETSWREQLSYAMEQVKDEGPILAMAPDTEPAAGRTAPRGWWMTDFFGYLQQGTRQGEVFRRLQTIKERLMGFNISDFPQEVVDVLAELDRNARAYGWEIGNGKPMTTILDYEDKNPFIEDNWRDQVVEASDLMPESEQAVRDLLDPREEQRKMLIQLCDDGATPVKHWSNRDSSSAMRQLGECRGLLAAGCEFLAHEDGRGCWDVTIYFPGFDYFEYGPDELPDGGLKNETYYVPTRERIDRNPDKDWY